MERKQDGNSERLSWRRRLTRWLRKLRGKVVMDAPPDWDVHPDVSQKIRDRENR